MKKFKVYFISGLTDHRLVSPVTVEGDSMLFGQDYFRIEGGEYRKKSVFACPRENLLYCEVVEEVSDDGRSGETAKGSTT